MRVCGTDIYMVKGDSEAILIKLNNPDGSPYNYGIGDTFTLSVVKINPYPNTDEVVIQKEVTAISEDNEISITLFNIDTKFLDVSRQYKYDIQWTRIAGVSPKTIIPYSNFILIEEATE